MERPITEYQYGVYKDIKEECRGIRHVYDFKHATYEEIMNFLLHDSEVVLQ